MPAGSGAPGMPRFVVRHRVRGALSAGPRHVPERTHHEPSTSLPATASPDPADVPNSNPFHADIDALVDSGVTAGCGSNRYCPKSNVTREQMAAFLNRLGALAPGKTPVVNADRVDGLDSAAFARPMYATVNADGSLARGAAVVSSSNIGTAGSYQVVFNRNITSCAYTATLGNPGSGNPARGFIVTALRATTTNAVFVETRTTADVLENRSFHLQVSCTAGEGQVTIGDVQEAPSTPDGTN